MGQFELECYLTSSWRSSYRSCYSYWSLPQLVSMLRNTLH